MDMAVVLFLLWMLQLLAVHFTNCIESSNRNRNWPSDFQFVTPRLKYITGESEKWKRKDLDELTQRAGSSQIKVEMAFTAFQQNFTLDLYQNRGLFASRYLEKQEKFKDSINHCFYHGTVRGRERSMVSLSICDEIEGLIHDGHMCYYLEPTQGSSDNRIHLFYRIKDLFLNDYYSTEQSLKHDGTELMNNGGQWKVHNRSTRASNFKIRRRVRRDVFTETKYVELVIINDHKQYETCGKNLTKTNLRAKQIANMVDAIFKPLNVRVALVAIETWDVTDMVKVDDDADTYLSNLIKYRKRKLLEKHPNDVTQLLTGIKLKDSVRGKAQVMSICTRQSVGVIRDYISNAAFTANTFAHELGHMFGMYHDDDLPHCVCNARNSPDSQLSGCVMSARVGREPATVFSNCSVEGLRKGLLRGLGTCLFNVPNTLFGGPVCGDGILGRGEQCDCGTAQECNDKGDTCCDHMTCKLHAHAECANGACCDNCRFKKRGAQCREKVNECDIPETCTGSSGICPKDLYVYNGYPCAQNTAYCYFGECQTHDKQCKDLWGSDAISGLDNCYRYHNTRGDKYGYCRKSRRGKYRACNLQDAKCGKLWCHASSLRPIVGIQRDVMSSFWTVDNNTITCKGTSFKTSMDAPEAAMTIEGTKCGERKVCLNRQCVSLHVLLKKAPRCPNNCSGHGLCNNVGKCYCFEPWSGTFCNKKFTIEPTSKTTKPLKTPLFSPTTKPHTLKPLTETTPTGTSVPDASLGVDAKVVYIVVSLSVVFLTVILIAGLYRYKHYFKNRKFVLQKKNKKAKFSPKPKVILI